MDVPTPVPPAKRLCCRDDASDASKSFDGVGSDDASDASSTAVAYSISI